MNTYTGAIDALNIVEAWIRKKEEITTDESKYHIRSVINEVHSEFSHSSSAVLFLYKPTFQIRNTAKKKERT